MQPPYGDDNAAGLFLDETSFLKKGESSVGVQRQWSGRAGKVENCLVRIFACLGRNHEFALIDFKLYLPESWAKDPERCIKAKIPEDQRVYQPKWRPALDLVKRARANKVKFGRVGADVLYGNNHEFLDELEDSGERLMADIHSNHKVLLDRPTLEKPSPRDGKRGRPATKLKLAASNDRSLYQRVDRICQDHFEQNSEEVSFRAGAKG
jgi:SRSO17 transposase